MHFHASNTGGETKFETSNQPRTNLGGEQTARPATRHKFCSVPLIIKPGSYEVKVKVKVVTAHACSRHPAKTVSLSVYARS